MTAGLPFAAEDDDEIELVAVDLGVARALWEGVPTARLLARIRLDRDEHDLVDANQRASGVDFADSTWDALLWRLLGGAPTSLDRIKRAVARHARAAFDEGRLAASDAAIAAFVHVLLSATDADASPAEGAAESLAVDDAVRRACGAFDERLGRAETDRRGAAFEACLLATTTAATTPAPLSLLASVLDAVSGDRALVASTSPLYPWGDEDLEVTQRRACLLERARLERGLLKMDRDMALALARATAKLAPAPVDRIVQEAQAVAARRGALVLFATREPRSMHGAPPAAPSSWLPSDFASDADAARVADALERGATTVPRVRAVIARGGDAALDAVGREMLLVERHPFASAAFAELLARVGRDRDVLRLVSYFAIAPDPAASARALSLCAASELPNVLRGWLESMLPRGDEAPDDEARRRLASCVAALAPYPALASAVKSLAARLGA